MTAQELQKRNERAQTLRVIQVDHDSFYVESSEGKICYKVMLEDESADCTCGDFNRNIKSDPNFKCKHIMSVLNCIPEGDYDKAQFLEKRKPKLDERFIITIDEKDFVTYPGLLDLGHQKGILKIEVETVQLPTKENEHFAVCKAIVISKNGESFVDVGDASPTNCSSRVSKHLLRMASTRAIARALRSFTNIGMTCLEELADLDDVIGNASQRGADKVRKIPPRKDNGKSKAAGSKPENAAGGKTEPGRKDEPGKKEEKPDNTTKTQAQEKPKDQPGNNGGGKAEKKKEAAPAKKEAPQASPNQSEGSALPKMSEAQKRAVYNLSRRRGISVEELEKMANEKYKAPLENLSSKDASEFIRTLQQAA